MDEAAITTTMPIGGNSTTLPSGGFSSDGRRLNMSLSEEEQTWQTGSSEQHGVEGRRLSFSSRRRTCTDNWLPWALVSFNANGEIINRCAYRYGTGVNSETGSNYWTAEDVLAQYVHGSMNANGGKLKVWTQMGPSHCVVGFGSLTDFVDQEMAGDRWQIVTLIISGIAILCFCVMVIPGLAGKSGTQRIGEDRGLMDRAAHADVE